MKFEMLQFVNLDANVFHDALAADRFHQLLLLELVRGTSHDVDLDPTLRSPDQMFR